MHTNDVVSITKTYEKLNLLVLEKKLFMQLLMIYFTNLKSFLN